MTPVRSLGFNAAILVVSIIMALLYLQPAFGAGAPARTLLVFSVWAGIALASGAVLVVRMARRQG